MKNTLVMLVCLCFFGAVHAQQTPKISELDSVIIDSKMKRPRKNSGKLITTITEEIIAANPGQSVATLINAVSGIEINGSRSNAGQNLSYFARGGNSRQVVILVDGIPQIDPSSISSEYDLRLVSASSISKIEILKGASSVLYGSGAATAVISITTKAGSKEPISATFTTSLGSNSASEADKKKYQIAEFTNAVSVHGTLKRFFYGVDFSHRFVDGLSAIAAPENENAFNSDDFNSFNTRFNLGLNLSDKVTISRFVSFDKFKATFDDFSYVDADNRFISEQLRSGGNFQWKYNRGMLVLNDNYSEIQREIVSSFPTKYEAKSYIADTYATYQLATSISALIGLQYADSKFSSFAVPFGGSNFEQQIDAETATHQSIDSYINITYTAPFGLAVAGGARLNNHSEYGSHTVYNINPSYRFDFETSALKVLASYSTAYITPSLFQLNDPLYGNLELQPEENITIEGGLEYNNNRGFRASAVYFQRTENNYVDFVTVDPDLFIFQYQNVGSEFMASGVEVEVTKNFGSKFNVLANYTNTKPDTDFALRIPEHKANLRLGYIFKEKTNIGLTYQFVGERDDSFFNPETFESEKISLESYNLVGLAISNQLSQNVKVFGSISNILNSEYEELYRYQTTGRNFRLGLQLKF